MEQAARIIPCYAADTSGVCSALYELGGMTVVHDASGCNSTYATHDEPRWVDMQSMIYISALTELDAILGDDERFIADVVSAAADQHPAFIAVCGSTMPMMTGTDFDAAAAEIERRSGIRTLALHTNGMHSYIDGASEAFYKAAQCFVTQRHPRIAAGVNILGATPLDFGMTGSIESIRTWLAEQGFSVVSCFAMGDTLRRISEASAAAVSLVISQTGTAAAEYLYQTFGIPYVCGVPFGTGFSGMLADVLRKAADSGECGTPCAIGNPSGRAEITVIGESISACSLAAEIGMRTGKAANVISPLPFDPRCMNGAAESPASESAIEAALAAARPAAVIADPLYRFILPRDTALVPLPHFAFSGRCFDSAIPNLIADRLDAFLREASL